MDYTPTEMRASTWLSTLGANEVPHSGRTLFHHLLGTWLLLKRHGEREDVCLAGMYHSIYGTNIFRHATLDGENQNDRGQVTDKIGVAAERIAWTFCHLASHFGLERPRELLAIRSTHLGRQLLEQDPQMVRDLRAIELANLIEQGGFRAVTRYL